MALSLVILAAGLGQRYGALKQVDELGPGSATLMEYSIFDARRAGFERVIFVIRPEIAASLRATVGARPRPILPIEYAVQRSPAGSGPGGEGRVKPWGTGHAVLAARELINERFIVANADDYYGPDAFSVAADFLRGNATDEFGLVSYALRDTLSAAGPVNRGICHSEEGRLTSIVEARGVTQRENGDGYWVDPSGVGRVLPGAVRVSMNLWAFTPKIFDFLQSAFADFLVTHRGSSSAELQLPDVVHLAISAGATVRVLESTGAWMGITYPQDRAAVARHLSEQVAAGAYPQRLWE